MRGDPSSIKHSPPSTCVPMCRPAFLRTYSTPNHPSSATLFPAPVPYCTRCAANVDVSSPTSCRLHSHTQTHRHTAIISAQPGQPRPRSRTRNCQLSTTCGGRGCPRTGLGPLHFLIHPHKLHRLHTVGQTRRCWVTGGTVAWGRGRCGDPDALPTARMQSLGCQRLRALPACLHSGKRAGQRA